jgi:uncharacterized phiE125 gp8 family phage protein
MEEPRYKLKTAPIFEPVTLAQFKRNLHIGAQDESDTTQDVYLQEILTASIESIQEDMGRQIARATYTLYLDDFPVSGVVNISRGPVSAISSVKYYNSSNVLTTISASDYQLDNVDLTGRIKFFNTYSVYANKINAVEIEFTNGWENAASVPKDIVDAVILTATERYLNPENAMMNYGQSLRIKASDIKVRKYRVQRF